MGWGRRMGVLLLLLAAGGAAASAEGGQSMDETADGARFTLAEGGAIALSLPLNAGTGYEWRLLRRPPAIVSVIEGERVGAPGARPGAPMRQTFTITAVAPGTAELLFGLIRPWEVEAAASTAAAVAGRFSVTLDVVRP